MNTVWSNLVQGTGTLYQSRALRFHDRYKDLYLPHFALADGTRMLEIGCGPGALAGALHRWYPHSHIHALDRDSCFIAFAQQHIPGVTFCEGDATSLPYRDASFDVTISNTVSEHVPTEAFYREQYRVLQPDGVCLMLSARRGINHTAPCLARESALEQEVWARVEERAKAIDEDAHVAAWALNEQQHPVAMAAAGFREISTAYIAVNLTPDNPENTPEMAHAMINSHRQTALDATFFLENGMADMVSPAEIAQMRAAINARYDERIALYNAGKKQWDTTVCMTMILRGVK